MIVWLKKREEIILVSKMSRSIVEEYADYSYEEKPWTLKVLWENIQSVLLLWHKSCSERDSKEKEGHVFRCVLEHNVEMQSLDINLVPVFQLTFATAQSVTMAYL